MATQVIMRPVYNRPEMLYLSIEAEVIARKYYNFTDNFLTLFIVEEGSPRVIFDLIKMYPFRNYCILRSDKFGLSKNILEGMKESFSLTSDYIIYIEDDVLVHKTYFQYIDTLLNMKGLGKVSVLSAYNFDDVGSINEVRRQNHYAALAPVIMKDFYTKYIKPCSCSNFYNNPARFAIELNEKYKEYWETKRYRYTDSSHHMQAGIINRLTDVAEIEENMWAILPGVNRQQHIGFVGHNRPGGILPGNSFDESLNNLRKIIKDANKMYEHSATKQYNDYRTFSSKLDAWDGTLRLI